MPIKRFGRTGDMMPPWTPEQMAPFIRDLKQSAETMTPEELAAYDARLDSRYAGDFSYRDEANALIAMAVRNGPLEDLHAGLWSSLLEDDALSRVRNVEMKVLMKFGSRMLAGILFLRDTEPHLFRRHAKGYGSMYCQFWERDVDSGTTAPDPLAGGLSRVTTHIAPTGSADMRRFIRDIEENTNRPISIAEEERVFSGGFSYRDEANALMAIVVRNGPLENLHAGKSSVLLEDDSLSRITDDEIKVLMLYATRMLAPLLALRDRSPQAYRQFLMMYGNMYCHLWERI